MQLSEGTTTYSIQHWIITWPLLSVFGNMMKHCLSCLIYYVQRSTKYYREKLKCKSFSGHTISVSPVLIFSFHNSRCWYSFTNRGRVESCVSFVRKESQRFKYGRTRYRTHILATKSRALANCTHHTIWPGIGLASYTLKMSQWKI